MNRPDTDHTPEVDDYRDSLTRIARHTPTCSTESDEAWSTRAWAGLFRDLQRIAREVLTRHGHKP